MTILTVVHFFIRESMMAFRPVHVAKYLEKPEKTIYRCLSILERESILSESHGLYWLNPKATIRPTLNPRKGCPLILAILLAVLAGQTFTDTELTAFFNKRIGRAITKLESAKLILTAPESELFQKSQTNVWLDNRMSRLVAESQWIRSRMGVMYGK